MRHRAASCGYPRRQRCEKALTFLPACGWLLWLALGCRGTSGIAAVGLALAAGFIGRRGRWAGWLRIYAVCVGQAVLAAVGWAAVSVAQAATMPELALATASALIVVVTVLTVAGSLLDAAAPLGLRTFPGRDAVLDHGEPAAWPSVCFQVPAHDEPPDLVIATLRALLSQDYPGRWMIQVVDNNTPDPRTWQPVRDFCTRHPERITFLRLENWPGYKADALNEAIRQLPGWVEHIAVVDADYLVEPDFLRQAVPHLADPRVAYVQTPQHYRQWHTSLLGRALFHMYEEYYQVRKPVRHEFNGIICVGTMAVIRRAAIESVGLWDENSCTEDAELSLRLLGSGWRGVFDHRSKGTGLMPLDFNGLRRQRFRWALGMMHIFRKHRRALLGLPDKGLRLTAAQRISFWGLANQYLTELAPLACAGLLAETLLPAHLDGGAGTQAAARVIPAVVLVLYVWTAAVRMRLATANTPHAGPADVIGALIVNAALAPVTAWACLRAFTTRRAVFLRTPKSSRGRSPWQAARDARIETALAGLCLLLGAGLATVGLVVPCVTAAVLAIVMGSGPLLVLGYQRAETSETEPARMQPSLTEPALPARSAVPAVAAEDLHHSYGSKQVLAGVSFDAARGEFLGILGPNGAGKTTTMEILEGLRRPTCGRVRLLGEDPSQRNPRLLARVGVQFQTSAFFDRLTALEQLETFAMLYRVPRSRARTTLELVGLADHAGVQECALSGGQRQRLAIACALVHAPEVLFLDEPTAALDSHARRDLWEILRSIQSEGTTIVYTTHHIDEAEILCDRVLVLHHGRVLATDSPTELIRVHGTLSRITIAHDALAPDTAATLPGVERTQHHGHQLTLVSTAPDLVLQCLARHGALRGVHVTPPSLEDVLLQLTSENPHR
ncbi:ATP-binding cassette domain-containing protein [Streptomyces sp. 769]|uniref:ATP-binding cassette domain-containing protein n=1 Tax=Streptomyces sp. 769 TaxID=1262452 RepID=UPI000AEEA9B1|nr:ATP-binding cassette domain-containing protein [Streptomyces sp. 769]